MLYKLLYNGKYLCDVYIANNFKDRLFGYMFRKKPHHDAILFKPCNSIHTFFMKFDIDILFLDENIRVIKKIEGLKKGKIIYEKAAAMVLEAKSGGFNNVMIGDQIDIGFI